MWQVNHIMEASWFSPGKVKEHMNFLLSGSSLTSSEKNVKASVMTHVFLQAQADAIRKGGHVTTGLAA